MQREGERKRERRLNEERGIGKVRSNRQKRNREMVRQTARQNERHAYINTC